MAKGFYSTIVVILRNIVRFLLKRYDVIYTEEPPASAVYIVHHQNLKGPIKIIIWLKTHLHMWVLSPFCSQTTCYKHYVDYTFTKRFGMPKFFAPVLAFPVSFFVSGLLKGIRAIPVYRGKREIIKTFEQSINALAIGESLLISPDINYTDTGSDIGEMYEGFLNIDRLFYKKTKAHVAFIPLHISKVNRSIYIGRSIYFRDSVNYREEKSIVLEKIKAEFLLTEKLTKEAI